MSSNQLLGLGGIPRTNALVLQLTQEIALPIEARLVDVEVFTLREIEGPRTPKQAVQSRLDVVELAVFEHGLAGCHGLVQNVRVGEGLHVAREGGGSGRVDSDLKLPVVDAVEDEICIPIAPDTTTERRGAVSALRPLGLSRELTYVVFPISPIPSKCRYVSTTVEPDNFITDFPDGSRPSGMVREFEV